MAFVIVTGMSGAGKSTVIKVLEDIGFFCVDNLPAKLIPKFAEICFNSSSEYNKVALGVDIRGGKAFAQLFEVLRQIEKEGYKFEILFLDATDTTLLKRFKETRRKHPLVSDGRISDGIKLERKMLSEAKSKADFIIDTSNILPRQLKQEIYRIFFEGKKFQSLIITILSFGFKYGIPNDSDLVFDVRFLPNPYYIAEMKPKTGNDQQVRDYVMKWDESKIFINKLEDLIEFLIPYYIKEGKNQLVISIGCTGGKHRSVTLANVLYDHLKQKEHRVVLLHRDVDKDNKRL